MCKIVLLYPYIKWMLKDKKYIRHIKVTLKTWFSCLVASYLQTVYDERTYHTWMKYLIKIKSLYDQPFLRHAKRWYSQLSVRNSKLRWKGNGCNITILFKYTNAWLVSLYFILEVSIMAAGTFQNFWIYENIQKQMLEQIVLWIYIT